MAEVTSERLAEIEARERAATPGPWHHVNNDDGRCMNAHVVSTKPFVDDFPERGEYVDRGCIVAITCLQAPRYAGVADGRHQENAEFLAAARTDVPDLCAAVRARDAEAERLRGLLREALGQIATHVHGADLLARIDAALGEGGTDGR